MYGYYFWPCRPRKLTIHTYIHGPKPFQRETHYSCMFTFSIQAKGKTAMASTRTWKANVLDSVVGDTPRKPKKAPKSLFSYKELHNKLVTPRSGKSIVHPHTHIHTSWHTSFHFVNCVFVLPQNSNSVYVCQCRPWKYTGNIGNQRFSGKTKSRFPWQGPRF